MTRGEPEPVAAVLRRVAGARAPDPAMAAIRDAWPGAVGATVARHAQPSRLQAGALVVRCSSATWAGELTLLQNQLQTAIRSALGDAAPDQPLRFEVGDLPEPAPAAPAPEPAPGPKLADRGRELAAAVADPALREAIAAAIAGSLAAAS